MFIKIKNPQKPGEYLVLHSSDFIEGVHELFKESAPATPAETTTSAPTEVTKTPAVTTGKKAKVAHK